VRGVASIEGVKRSLSWREVSAAAGLEVSWQARPEGDIQIALFPWLHDGAARYGYARCTLADAGRFTLAPGLIEAIAAGEPRANRMAVTMMRRGRGRAETRDGFVEIETEARFNGWLVLAP
jgi:hypothetical protein